MALWEVSTSLAMHARCVGMKAQGGLQLSTRQSKEEKRKRKKSRGAWRKKRGQMWQNNKKFMNLSENILSLFSADLKFSK